MLVDFTFQLVHNTLVTLIPGITAPGDWPSTFFDEGFVEVFRRLGKYEHTADDVSAIITLLAMRSGQTVLDVPCGFGRHIPHLLASGLNVTGLDASPHLLSLARDRCPGAEYVLGDMRQPPPKPFDYVLNLWSSFGYLKEENDDLTALAAWYSVLSPAGLLLMELTDFERAAYENRTREESTSYKRTTTNGVLEEAVFDWIHCRVVNRYSFGDWTRVCTSRLYSQERLRSMITSVGFSSVSVFGGFNGRPKGRRDRLVLVAEKL